MSDEKRIDFLAELMNSSAVLEWGGTLTDENRRELNLLSAMIFTRYEFHRRTNDTPQAFRLAVDDARNAPDSGGEPK